MRSLAWRGNARWGEAWLGTAWQGAIRPNERETNLCAARRGEARQGRVRYGKDSDDGAGRFDSAPSLCRRTRLIVHGGSSASAFPQARNPDEQTAR